MSLDTSELSHGTPSQTVLDHLSMLRKSDAPTHGGKVLAYVYDSGMPELDALANEAAEMVRPLNGLDPTVFPSIAAMETDVIAFTRRALNGEKRRAGGKVVGSVTSGGTESCLLAVKTARDLWRSSAASRSCDRPRIVAPTTVHAAFHKAARLFDLELDLVPCEPDGTVKAQRIIERLDGDVALVVLSAPAYPSGAVDPIAEVSEAALARGISCHVDSCFGGFALPWWPNVPAWDFRLPGVTSISADLHKYGYSPKGASVLLHRGRYRHRKQFFAVTSWPGYPVVNPTLLGSKSASPLAAAWAIVHRLGAEGYRDLIASCARSAQQIINEVSGITGLKVQGNPIGPAISLVADDRLPAHMQVDPHHLADEMVKTGFKIQHQPGLLQSDGVRLPHSAHLTITPVTEQSLPEFLAALTKSADAVRGKPAARVTAALAAIRLLGYSESRLPGPNEAWTILRLAGAAPKPIGRSKNGTMPGKMAPLMALVEALPTSVSEALLTELIARVNES